MPNPNQPAIPPLTAPASPLPRHTLDAPVIGASRTPDHHTSIAAATRDIGRRGGQRERLAVAHATHPDGLTDEEAADVATINVRSSPWKRCGELREWGYLEYAGFDRPTTTGSAAKVWRLTRPAVHALYQRGIYTTLRTP